MAPAISTRANPRSSDDAVAREGYQRHGAELYRFALSRLGDEAAAQDAVQETIVRAWRFGGRYDPALGSLRTWLYAIMRNVVNDHASATGRRPVPVAPPDDEQQGADAMTDPSVGVADSDLVTRALARVSADHRTAIVETYLRDRPYADVADELGVSVSTLRSRVFYGLKQLRFAMNAMEVEQ